MAKLIIPAVTGAVLQLLLYIFVKIEDSITFQNCGVDIEIVK
jgi:hypothetical protein